MILHKGQVFTLPQPTWTSIISLPLLSLPFSNVSRRILREKLHSTKSFNLHHHPTKFLPSQTSRDLKKLVADGPSAVAIPPRTLVVNLVLPKLLQPPRKSLFVVNWQ